MRHVFRFVLPACLFLMLSGCARPSIKVALMTKLDAGSIIGTSEIAAVKEFERLHPKSPIQIIPFDDGWDPVRTKQAYAEIQNNDIRYIITSHTSTCANEIANDINRDKRLTIITGATTTRLSGKDDYILRVIPDVIREQNIIAQRIASLNPQKLLIIRDLSNSGYTIPAQEAFLIKLNNIVPHVKVNTVDIDANKFEIHSLEPVLSSTNFNVIYLLIGGYKNIAGNIAQYAHRYQNGATIVFTPWMNNKELVNTAGPAISHSILPSLFPSRKEDKAIDDYMTSIETNFHVSPTIISLKVYQAIEILDMAFMARATTPEKTKQWILTQRSIKTRLGTIGLDAFGDTTEEYYFINDISGEFN